MFGNIVRGGDNLIKKVIARDNERAPFSAVCEPILSAGAKLIITLAYADSTVSSVGLRLTNRQDARLMLPFAKAGIGDTGLDLFKLLKACNRVLMKTRFWRPVAGVVLVLQRADGSIATGDVNLGKAQTERAIDAAQDALTGLANG